MSVTGTVTVTLIWGIRNGEAFRVNALIHLHNALPNSMRSRQRPTVRPLLKPVLLCLWVICILPYVRAAMATTKTAASLGHWQSPISSQLITSKVWRDPVHSSRRTPHSTSALVDTLNNAPAHRNNRSCGWAPQVCCQMAMCFGLRHARLSRGAQCSCAGEAGAQCCVWAWRHRSRLVQQTDMRTTRSLAQWGSLCVLPI